MQFLIKSKFQCRDYSNFHYGLLNSSGFTLEKRDDDLIEEGVAVPTVFVINEVAIEQHGK